MTKKRTFVAVLISLVCAFVLIFSMGVMAACGNETADTEEKTETAETVGGAWYYGSTVPSDALGVAGDYYLNTNTLASYKKTEAGWTTVAMDESGNWLYGQGAPTEGGEANDFYLDLKSGNLYHKTEEGWGEPVLQLFGRDGVVWYSGNGEPGDGPEAFTDAVAGDFYIDYGSWTVYQLQENREWLELGSIKGTTPQAANYTVTFDARTSAGAVLDLETIKKQDPRNADKWSSDGEYITYRVTKGDSIENLPLPTLAHCTFLGWYTGLGVNDAQITNLTPITRSLRLTARYEFSDTTHVVSMTKGGAEVVDGSNETLIWKTGKAAIDYKEDYNFKVVAAETDNIQIYVKRANAAPVVWGGNNTSGTVKRANWHAGVYDITVKDGYFRTTTLVTKENFDKYLDGTSPTLNVYTIMVVRNGDWENPLASFTTHFENVASADTSKPYTEQGKLEDLTDTHGADWRDVQAGETVRESFIISHDALTVGAQPKITMKVTAWTSDNGSTQYYTKDAPQYEETFVYTLDPDGASFSVERTDELCRGDDWNRPKENWTPRGEDGWVSEWNYEGYIKVSTVKLSNGFLEFIVESNYTSILNSFKVYHHTVSLMYELDGAKLDVLGNSSDGFDGSNPTTAELNVRAMTELSGGASQFYAGTPQNFTHTIASPSKQSTVRPTIDKSKLDYFYLIIDGVRADIDLEGHTEVNERDFSFQADVTNPNVNEIKINLQQFIFNTEGTKHIERHYSYHGVDQVSIYTVRVIPADAAQNANELILKAWEKYFKDHDLLEGEAPNYTLKAGLSSSGATLMLNYINQMNEGTLDYNDATLNKNLFPVGMGHGPFGSMLKELGDPGEFALLMELVNGGAEPDPETLAKFNEALAALNVKYSARIQALAQKYTFGSHTTTVDMLYTYYALNIIPHFDDSTQQAHGTQLKGLTYCLFYGMSFDLTEGGDSNKIISTMGLYMNLFHTPEVAMNFVELAFEKYGDIEAAEFYEEIYEAFDAAELSTEETAAFEALTAAEASVQAAGGLENASEAIVEDYMTKLQALCALYGKRTVS